MGRGISHLYAVVVRARTDGDGFRMLQACATKALIEAQAIRKGGVSTDMQPFSAKTCRMCIEKGRLNA